MAELTQVQAQLDEAVALDSAAFYRSLAMQAHLARGFLAASLASIDDIKGVYAVTENGDVRVTVLVGDFWGEARKQIHAAVNSLRKQLDVPNVDIVVLPAQAVGDNLEGRPDCERWA